MRTSLTAPAFLATLLACGCASSAWEKTESLPGGRLYIPKLYAPLLPGSIYPDKKILLPAKGRPSLVVVCPAKSDCRESEVLDQAAQRGIVVLVTKAANSAIAARPEVDPARTGTLIVTPTSLRVFVTPPPQAAASPSPSSPSKKILIAALLSDAPLEAPDGTVLKLYSPSKKDLLPSEAFRDAVEWLAGELTSP
ncbi:MAG: hypothetical protein ABI584_07105 [Acidobacteriota bacterium]